MKDWEGWEARGSVLLRNVRFPFMEGRYLEDVSSEQSMEDVALDGMLLDAGMPKGTQKMCLPCSRPRPVSGPTLVGGSVSDPPSAF